MPTVPAGFTRVGCGYMNSQQGIGRGHPTYPSSIFKTVSAIIPVFGFGTFQTLTLASGEPVIAYYDVWPNVYSRQIITITQSDGHNKTVTTTYYPYMDNLGVNYKDVVTIGSLHTYIYEIDSWITSSTTYYEFTFWADAAHTITGTCTAQLQGTIYDPTAAGPFDPTDATNGWESLTTNAQALLDTVEPMIDGTVTGLECYVVWPIKDAPYYQLIDMFDPIFTSYTSFTIPLIVAAAARGFPLRNNAIEIGPLPFISNALFQSYQFQRAIVDFPHWDDYYSSQVPNYGFCLSMYSIWALNGNPPNLLPYGPVYNPWPNDNDHLTFYVQPVDVPFTIIASSLADTSSWIPGGANPVGHGSHVIFTPAFAYASIQAVSTSYSYGLLGFRSFNY